MLKRACLVRSWSHLFAIAALALGGCEQFALSGAKLGLEATSHPPDETAPDQEQRSSAVEGALASPTWVEVVPAPAKASGAHWRNSVVEAIIVAPPESRPDLRKYLKSDNPVVAGNAAIVASRWHQSGIESNLNRAVSDDALKLTMRCAAAEALGNLDSSEATRRLADLADRYGRSTDSAQAYMPELHAQLIRSLSLHHSADLAPRVEAALESPAPRVREAALTALRDAPQLVEASKWVGLSADPAPVVRAAAMRAIGKARQPEDFERLKRGLSDEDMQVRLAAISALGAVGGQDASAALKNIQKSPSELARAAACTALGPMGDPEALITATEDKAYRVRQAAADVLGRSPHASAQPTEAAVRSATILIKDRSAEVQKRMIDALPAWPLAKAGPLLMAAIEHGGYEGRKKAAHQLAERWPPAVAFPVDAPVGDRGTALAKLRHEWQTEFGSTSSAVDPLSTSAPRFKVASAEGLQKAAALLKQLQVGTAGSPEHQRAIDEAAAGGSQILAALEQMAEQGESIPDELHRGLLPRLSPTFATIEQLQAADLSRRRKAAAQLVAGVGQSPLGKLATDRISALSTAETDPVVWQSILAVSKNDSNESAIHLAYVATGSGSPEVRRRACEYLFEHPNNRHAAVLGRLVDDPQEAVATVAIRGLSAANALADHAPLLRALGHRNKRLRYEAAKALARHQSDEGIAALQRLALEADPELRRQVATAIGELHNPDLLPALIAMLDDRADVRNAAQRSLIMIAGRDVAVDRDGQRLVASEASRAWRAWYEDEHAGQRAGDQL